MPLPLLFSASNFDAISSVINFKRGLSIDLPDREERFPYVALEEVVEDIVLVKEGVDGRAESCELKLSSSRWVQLETAT